MRAQAATLGGSVVSGILASACCLGPLVLSLLGVSGAAFAQRFEPFRPYLLMLRDTRTGEPLMMAWVANPASQGPSH